ncbi:MAG: hypothetical protein ABR596_07885 [Halarsenatibacteraceae bacterium]
MLKKKIKSLKLEFKMMPVNVANLMLTGFCFYDYIMIRVFNYKINIIKYFYDKLDFIKKRV